MGKKQESELKVKVRYVPCNPREWDEALNLFAQMVAEEHLKGQLGQNNSAFEPDIFIHSIKKLTPVCI